MVMQTNKPRSRKGARLIAAVIATVGVLFGVLVAPATPALAAPVTGFKAGSIISDSLFYDGATMSSSQVQSFLNAQVPRCTIGDSGRKAGSKYGNTKIANKCLRDFKMTTTSYASDSFCKAYVGKANETAAQIIAKVGQACGISQKVLLVLLQKEQYLVTDTWPTVLQYSSATGYACPDTAPCSASEQGFFKQVYLAAWQFKVYQARYTGFNYWPFRSNYIQYHPNASCGGSNVYIENRATAGLYIYTPYQPNSASLQAYPGEGNSCSSYGNRNFYGMYKGWFGSPNTAYDISGKILDYWNVHQGWLGQPTRNAVTLSVSGGGVMQQFDGGVIYASNAGSVVGITMTSPILAAYSKAGGIEGAWGWPIEAYKGVTGTTATGTMKFQKGVVGEKKSVGAYFVPNALVASWNSAGGMTGSWGYPVANASSSGGATQQLFQKAAAAVQSGKTSVVAMPYAKMWLAQGGITGALGIPKGTVKSVTGGSMLDFANGSVFSKGSTETTMFTVPTGQLLSGYMQAGGPIGSWGWPTGKYLCTSGSSECSMPFTSGTAVWNAKRGMLFTPFTVPSMPGAKPGSGESVSGGTVR